MPSEVCHRKDSHLMHEDFRLPVAVQKEVILEMILSLIFSHRNLISMFSPVPSNNCELIGENHCPNEFFRVILSMSMSFISGFGRVTT